MIAVLNQRSKKYYSLLKLKIRNRFKSNVVLSEYYFGYGANLDISRFERNNMLAEEVGVATLVDHELKFSLATECIGKSYAGVHEATGKNVPGVLVNIDKLSLSYLDTLEWCGFGAYERVLKNVEANGSSYMAWVYIVKYPDFNRVPSSLYLNNMINAAKDKGFSGEYISFLENQECKSSFDIDHGFSLRTYSSSRKFVNSLSLLYKLHDRLRDKLCNLI